MKRIVFVCLTLALLIACQPTPEHDVVINKAEIDAEEVYLQTAAPVLPNAEPESDSGEPSGEPSTVVPRITLSDRISAPEHWTEEPFSANIPFGSTLTVHIDADVHVPDVERVGVYTVNFDVPFSETQQKGLILKYLGEQAQPFCVNENGKPQRKWQIEEEMKTFKYELEQYQQADDPEMREVMTRQTEEQLEQDMARYRDAPDDWVHLAWDGKCLSGRGSDAGWISLYAATDQPAHYRKLTFSAYVLEYLDETIPLAEDFTFSSSAAQQRSAIAASPQTDGERAAAALAEDALNALGVGTFTVKNVSQGLDGFIIGRDKAENGYFVHLWMTKDGIPIYNFQAWSGDDPARERAEKAGYLEARDYSVYMPEQVTATVGVRGGRLASISVQGLHHETGCVNDNVQLLPFSEIARIFREQIVYHYFVGSDDAKDESDWNEQLYVTDAYLSMMRVRKKDSADEFYLLPVWDFSFYRESKWTYYPDEATRERLRDFSRSYSTLTINAVDGSIIDRNVGY